MPRRDWTDAERDRLRDLHAAGLNDRDIAAALRRARDVARRQRVRLGLPQQGRSAAYRARVGALKRRANKGVWTFLSRAKAARMGWPGAAGPGQVRVLQLLHDFGPLTALDVARALGLAPTWAREHLAALGAAGLTAEVGTRPTGGMTARVWALGPGVQRHRPERERGEGPVPPMPLHLRNRGEAG